jgi:hypothetical protein
MGAEEDVIREDLAAMPQEGCAHNANSVIFVGVYLENR